MIGRIVKLISNDYTVKTDDLKLYTCKARGKFRNDRIKPLVGDIVEFDSKNNYYYIFYLLNIPSFIFYKFSIHYI